jgi:hypothetical protein
MFFTKSKPPKDCLSNPQRIEKMRSQIREAIDAASEGKERDWGLLKDIASTLRNQAQNIDMILARRPIV